MINSGTGQKFNYSNECVTVFVNLKEKVLIDIEVIAAASVFKMQRLKTDTSPLPDGMLATLTEDGTDLMDLLAGNLERMLNNLDRTDVRESLEDHAIPPGLS